MGSSYLTFLNMNLLIALAFALWPEPTEFNSGASTLWLSPHVEILTSSANKTGGLYSARSVDIGLEQTKTISEQKILQSAIRRTKQRITSSKFVPWKLHSRTTEFEPPKNASFPTITTVQINQQGGATKENLLAEDFFLGDESYGITISANGVAEIESRSTLGTIRGLQTFEQLFFTHSDNAKIYTPYAPLLIQDSPRWRHRGLNLDIARNVFRPVDIMRTLDAMATCKMSRLHLHATDAQSWPIEIPALPALAEKGAYWKHLTWSPKDLHQVQLYGLKRGVSVYLEIDMPGHTGSIANAYPDLITAFNLSDWSTFAAEPPSGSLKLNSPAVYDFLKTLFSDLLPRVSPYTTLFHNGGDEVNKNAFLLDETVKSNSSTVLQPLVQKLMSNVTDQVRAAGLTPVLWEEMLLDWNLTFPSASKNTSATPDVIIQVWQDAANLQSVLKKGYRALFGDYHNWYLDCGHGGFLDPYPSRVSPPGVPYNTSEGVATQIQDPFIDYCQPYKNWRHIYVYDPHVNITGEVRHLIEGGEVHMWSEQTDAVNLDSRIWPRAAAAAEVLWSGPRNASMIKAASHRLAGWRERVVLDYSIRAGPVQMNWCLMESGCDL